VFLWVFGGGRLVTRDICNTWHRSCGGNALCQTTYRTSLSVHHITWVIGCARLSEKGDRSLHLSREHCSAPR